MSSEKGKKRRLASDLEKQLLLQLIQKEKFVECRENSARVWKEKKLAWDRITSEFNQQSGAIPTDTRFLKKMWDIHEIKNKKDVAKEKKERNRTGGGAIDAASLVRDEICDGVSACVGNLHPLRNDVDCDAGYHEDSNAGENI